VSRRTPEQRREAARKFVAEHGHHAGRDARDAIAAELHALSERAPVSIDALRAELAALAREPALGWGALQASAHLAPYAAPHPISDPRVVRTTEGDSAEYWAHCAHMFPYASVACHYVLQAQHAAGLS
jgi:hypothetical protein